MDRLYILVRSDISPGLQIAQACHAMRSFASKFPELDKAWFMGGNNIVVLNVADEEALCDEIERFNQKGFRCAWFKEPDLNDQFTACAVEESAKPLVRSLRLALAS